MPRKAVLYVQRHAKVPIIARDTGLAILKLCPEPLPPAARTATSATDNAHATTLEGEWQWIDWLHASEGPRAK
eukprot:5068350-Pleurochrysis_carterae.AAC.1